MCSNQSIFLLNFSRYFKHFILCFRPTDLSIIAVASNNLAVLNRDQNLFDSRKRIKAATAPEAEPKLNAFQKKIVQVNEALLAIYTGQVTINETATKKICFNFYFSTKRQNVFLIK